MIFCGPIPTPSTKAGNSTSKEESALPTASASWTLSSKSMTSTSSAGHTRSSRKAINFCMHALCSLSFQSPIIAASFRISELCCRSLLIWSAAWCSSRGMWTTPAKFRGNSHRLKLFLMMSWRRNPIKWAKRKQSWMTKRLQLLLASRLSTPRT